VKAACGVPCTPRQTCLFPFCSQVCAPSEEISPLVKGAWYARRMRVHGLASFLPGFFDAFCLRAFEQPPQLICFRFTKIYVWNLAARILLTICSSIREMPQRLTSSCSPFLLGFQKSPYGLFAGGLETRPHCGDASLITYGASSFSVPLVTSSYPPVPGAAMSPPSGFCGHNSAPFRGMLVLLPGTPLRLASPCLPADGTCPAPSRSFSFTKFFRSEYSHSPSLPLPLDPLKCNPFSFVFSSLPRFCSRHWIQGVCS